MCILKRIFGKSDPLDSLRRAIDQNRWADALAIGEGLDRTGLSPDASGEFDELLVAAGDGLAELNLSEGQACLRAGNIGRAAEHFSLSSAQARSEELCSRIQAAMSELTAPQGESTPPPAPAAHGCGSGCSSHGGSDAAEPLPGGGQDDFDSQTRLELLLAGYTPEMAKRYRKLRGPFLEGFLLAHGGAENEAMKLFDKVPEEDRDDLFHFEKGALLARLGDPERGCRELEMALSGNPQNFLAFETLVDLEMAGGKEQQAEQRLRRMLDRRQAQGFCHGRLAAVMVRRGELETALEHGRAALGQGDADPETVYLTASILERSGSLNEAEALLASLSGGGCSGGANVPLAEFWLRQGRNPEKALEAFKGALRQEPSNPRWPLRIAQAYHALGWKKEALPLVEKVLAERDLPEGLHREGTELLEACRKG